MAPITRALTVLLMHSFIYTLLLDLIEVGYNCLHANTEQYCPLAERHRLFTEKTLHLLQ